MTTAVAAREKPMVLKPDVVREILDGTRTTLRIPFPGRPTEGREEGEWMLPAPGRGLSWYTNYQRVDVINRKTKQLVSRTEAYVPLDEWLPRCCPYRVGSRIWVREAFYDRTDYAAIGAIRLDPIVYVADGERGGWLKHSTSSMPRWACRLVLAVTDVTVERADNPFVWVVSFRRVES